MKEEEWKVLTKESNNKRHKQKENDNDDLIKIDKEFLNQLMKAPQLSKGKYASGLSSYCNRRRKSFISTNELKTKTVSKIKSKEHNANFRTLAWENKEDRRQSDLMQF